ncbi:MAG: HAD family hydrolase [Candidatus Woesearchaeota archaeon]
MIPKPTNNHDKILVFDVDGVLGDFEQLRILRDKAHIAAVAEKKGMTIAESSILFYDTKKRLKHLGKPSTVDTMNHLGITDEEFFSIMNSVPIEGNIIPTKDVIRVLSRLSDNAVICALTNTPYEATVKTLEHLGILKFFSKIYSIDRYSYKKPSSDIFRRIATDFGCTDVYSIGDSIEKDLTPAKSIGMKTIHFPGTDKEHKDVDHSITDLKEIINILGFNH